MKKVFCTIMALLMLVMLFTACKPNIIKKPNEDYEVNLDIDRNITETLRILVPSNDGDLEAGYIEALIPGFKEMFPNVTIKLDRRTISDEKYAESVSAAIASGNVPDLFYTNTAFYYYLVAKNCVISLEPYYEASEKAGVFDMDADFYTSFFNMSVYEGERYIVPRSMDSVVSYYNTEILEAAGIDPKTDKRFNNSWTWDDLISVCQDVNDFITSPAGKAAGYGDCYALQADFDWEAVFNALMLSYGVNAFDENGDVAIDCPEMYELANMLRDLKKEGRILKESTSGFRFTNGKCAFYFSSLGPSRMDLNASVKGKFDVLPFPLIMAKGTPYIGCGFAGWGISSTAEGVKRDLAWQFLNYMISREGQMALINNGLATPSIRVELAEEKQWSKGYSDLNLDAWLVGEEYKVSSKFFTKHDPSCSFDILTELQAFWLNLTDSTSKSVESCIKTCVEALEKATAK